MTKTFRQCAGVVVFNKEGLVFLGNRVDTSVDAWQFPQGGIEQGETPAIAARRELQEETSITSVQLVCIADKPYRYEFSDEIKEKLRKRHIYNDGQDIHFALFYFDGDESEINVKTHLQEFKGYQWNTFDFAVNNVVDFKKDAYTFIADIFVPKIHQYLRLPLDISKDLS